MQEFRMKWSIIATFLENCRKNPKLIAKVQAKKCNFRLQHLSVTINFPEQMRILLSVKLFEITYFSIVLLKTLI